MKSRQKFDLNLLRVFMSAYQTGSVTKAAEQLDLTQSAVSNALARLKVQTGTELFTRTGRGIKPTRFAQSFYQDLQLPLLDIESMLEGIAQFDPMTCHRQFKVYCNEALIHELRKKLDELLLETRVEIILMEPPSNHEQLYEDLQLELVDCLIDVDKANSPLFASQTLRQESLCCVISSAFSDRWGATISKQQYLDARHVLLKMRRFQLPFIDWLVGEVLPPRQVYSEHASLMGLLAAVSYSDAIATAPVSFASQYCDVFKE